MIGVIKAGIIPGLFCFVFTIYRYKNSMIMFVRPTKEQRDFIPTPLAARKNIDKTGVGIIDQLIVPDYIANAADVNHLEEKAVKNEMEPSTANIVEYKLKTTGTDFKSFDPRVMIEG